MTISVLIFGITGYIGGSVFNRIKETHPDFSYTALVRRKQDVVAVESSGARAVRGSKENLPLIDRLASQSDIVINAANADDVLFIKAVIAGLTCRARRGISTRKPVLIHTSGTGVIGGASTGSFNKGTNEKIWNDANVEDIKSIYKSQIHRNVDLEVFAASERGEIETYVIAPSTIYGKGRGPVRKTSMQIPAFIRLAVEMKQTIHLGPGTNVWNHVHIDDNSELYRLVFDRALSGRHTGKSYENFFWSSVGEHQMRDVSSKIATILHKKGLVATPTSQSVNPSEGKPLPIGLLYTSNNSRSVSEKAFTQLKWKPVHQSLLDALEEEVELVISQL